MQEFLKLFTSMDFTKPFALVLFFITFVSIIAYVYIGRERSKRLESYRFIPLDDSDKDDNEQKT